MDDSFIFCWMKTKDKLKKNGYCLCILYEILKNYGYLKTILIVKAARQRLDHLRRLRLQIALQGTAEPIQLQQAGQTSASKSCALSRMHRSD